MAKAKLKPHKNSSTQVSAPAVQAFSSALVSGTHFDPLDLLTAVAKGKPVMAAFSPSKSAAAQPVYPTLEQRLRAAMILLRLKLLKEKRGGAADLESDDIEKAPDDFSAFTSVSTVRNLCAEHNNPKDSCEVPPA